jgi:hypothetical protein
MIGTALCHLSQGLGRVEACPGGSCAFWQADAEACAIVPLTDDVRTNADLAQHLLELRRELESCRVDEEQREARSLFFRVLYDTHTGESL